MEKEKLLIIAIVSFIVGFLTSFIIDIYLKIKDCEAKGGVYVNEYCLKLEQIK